jgi:hypothetical protein
MAKKPVNIDVGMVSIHDNTTGTNDVALGANSQPNAHSEKKAEKAPKGNLLDIQKYLSQNVDLKLKDIQIRAFCQQFHGRILPRERWEQIIHKELTRKVR